MSKSFFTLCVLLLSTTNTGLSKSPFNGKTVGDLNVGVLVPLSGAQKPYGEEAKIAIDIAFEGLKTKYPEVASKITIAYRDTKSIPSIAAKGTDELVKKHRASVIFGGITAVTSRGIATATQKTKTPYLSPAIYSKKLCYYDKNTLCGGASHHWIGLTMGRYAKANLGYTKGAVILQGTTARERDYANGFIEGFTKYGGKINFFADGKKVPLNLKENLSAARKKGAQVFFLPSSAKQAVESLNAMKSMGISVAALGSEEWGHPQISRLLGGRVAQPVFFPSQFNHTIEDQKIAEFSSLFKTKSKRSPSTLAALTYDSINGLFEAFIQAKSARKKPFVSSLRRLKQIDGIMGNQSYDRQGFLRRPLALYKLNSNGSSFREIIDPLK